MFAINYFGNKSRSISKIEDEIGQIGSQSRIYDYNTGIYTRILPCNERKYAFAESGIEAIGVLYNMYGFEKVLDCKRYDAHKLMKLIETSINELGELTVEQINFILSNGFLEFLNKVNDELSNKKEFQTLLKTERILKQFETEGKIGYNEVLSKINMELSNKILEEEERKILEQLIQVYKNEMFKNKRENNELLSEKQKELQQHTSEEIARSTMKEEALANIIEGKSREIKMSNYGFDENGLMLGEYKIEEVESLYNVLKNEFDADGLPISKEYVGTEIAEIIYNYIKYIKDTKRNEIDKTI